MEQDLREFAGWFRKLYGLKETDPGSYSPLVLAYIGDAVYELVIRSYTVGLGNRPASELHHMSAELVNAHFQSQMIETIKSQLTEEELLDQGITQSTIRLSIGTEHIDDIIEDLEKGFAAI